MTGPEPPRPVAERERSRFAVGEASVVPVSSGSFQGEALNILDRWRIDLRGEPDLTALQVMLAALAKPAFAARVAATIEAQPTPDARRDVESLLTDMTLRLEALIHRRRTSAKLVEVIALGAPSALITGAFLAPLTMTETSPLYALTLAAAAGIALIRGTLGYRRVQDEIHVLNGILRGVRRIAGLAKLEIP